MIWVVGGYALLMTIIAARLGVKEYDARAEAIRLRIACERAEAALEELAGLAGSEEIETPRATFLTGDALAARLGVDIKSQPR